MPDYLFYPFDDGTGIDTVDGLAPGVGAQGGTTPASPRIGELIRSDSTYPGGFWNVGAADTIFVIGHTAEGMKVLADSTKTPIDQSEVVKRLKDCSLPTTVNCRIVMYACESGKGGSASLAAKVASALKTNGFACCNNVWGFMHKVSTKANRDGRMCVMYGGSWQPYQDLEHVLERVPPNH